MFGRRRGDSNPATPWLGQIWDNDSYSRRIAVAIGLMSSTVSPANRGVPGITPGLPGGDIGVNEHWLSPLQEFRGMPRFIIDPESKRLDKVFSYPNTSGLIDPSLLAMSAHQIGPGL